MNDTCIRDGYCKWTGWGLVTCGIAFGVGPTHIAVSILRLRDGEWTDGSVFTKGTNCTELVVGAVVPGGHVVVASTVAEITELPSFFWGGTF